MRKATLTAVLGSAALVLALTACGGGGSDEASSGGNDTITYWATNQGPTIPDDQKILGTEIQKFTQQTGIKVKLEVISWSDINNRILSATVTRKGPDVLNFGNTNAFTFGSTGALMTFDNNALGEIGGKDKFLGPVFAAADLKPVTSVPLYSQAYGLFYNKKLFTNAGLQPPTTWQDAVADAQKLTNPAAGQYGFSLAGASLSETMHMLYVFARQNGGAPFDKDNKPTFTTGGMVAAAQQLIGLYSNKVAVPGSAQYTSTTDALGDLAHGKAAMVFSQGNGITTLTNQGMTDGDFGVVPVPVLDPLPAGGHDTASYVAGTNISIFANTPHKDAALKFVKFMTSPEEQQILDRAYNVLPVLKNASTDFMSNQDMAKTFVDILSTKSEPLPVTGDNNSFQTNAGGAVSQILGRAATGEKISDDTVRKALSDAQDKMPVK